MKKQTKKVAKKKNQSTHIFSRVVAKKHYLEFFTALLTIPFLITVLILNLNALQNINKPKDEEKANLLEKSFFTKPSDEKTISVSPNPDETVIPCKEDIGPVDISSPDENATVTENPVFVEVNYSDDSYCPAVWSYRINGKSWSAYGDSSIALYNLLQGNIKVELRVKSSSGGQEKTLTRNFVYKGTTVVSPPDENQQGSSSAH